MTSATEMRTTTVDLTGLITVLGDHLYSTPTVVVRELVQNGHDSCTRRKLEAQGAPTPQIRVSIDSERGVLRVVDNGAGLTRDEIVEYLATVGRGYTRKLREEGRSEELIGLFGLGFLSAFVVGERVVLRTTSFQDPSRGWQYQSRDGERYTIDETPPREVGTEVEITLKPSMRGVLSTESLGGLLHRYCALLPHSVYVGESETALNAEAPPWRDPDLAGNTVKAKRARLAFATRFEGHFEPLCTFEVKPRDGIDVRGMLWVQSGQTYGTSDNRNLSVFVRGMLLSRDVRELVPAWAGFIGGVIESTRLTPTASREDLQRDDVYDAVSRNITATLIEGLSDLARREPETWRRVLTRHNESLRGAALCDDALFDLLCDELTVPTSEGELTPRAVFQRSQGKAHASLSVSGGFEETLFRALKVPIAFGYRYATLPFLMRYAERRGGTVVELGTDAGNREVFKRAEMPASELEWLGKTLARSTESIVTARFKPTSLPLVLVPDREAELKQKIESDQADQRISTAALGLARLYTKSIEQRATTRLYVNVDSPAIVALLKARGGDAVKVERAVALLRTLVSVMSTGGESESANDLDETLQRYSDVVTAMLES